MSLQDRLAALISAIGSDIKELYETADNAVPMGATGTTIASGTTSSGYFIHMLLSAFQPGTNGETVMFETYRGTASQRAFWLNENNSPRGASVNDEPALKLFGPNANLSYAGLLFSIFKAYGTQTHIWSMHTDGNPRIGSGTTAGVNCVLVENGATAPSGLPDGTLIFEKPA